ncbi:uncharacterized protein LOC132062015 [Lycium ferocissimum]|uniref:uncharacterized protein LOC132062015 n=1 Tax=Lycium ferocissimum TaxID=112874 RepID=UPI0028155ECD|nr:uncharacterized protein LOC132062015 [Lycium ferocissimum]
MGDFNCITEPGEKRGGNPHRVDNSFPFIDCINDCELEDPGYTGSIFTWCHHRCPAERVWKRLDRALINQKLMMNFPDSTVTHLVQTGSDHALSLLMLKTPIIDIVQQAWDEHVEGSPMWRFHMKLKATCKKLSWWSNNILGDIFEATKTKEKQVADLEEICLQENSGENMEKYNEANAKLIRHYKQEESFWRQTSGIKWHAEGDLNTKFFHYVISSKRQRLKLNKIKNSLVKFYEHIFTDDNVNRDMFMVQILPSLVTNEDNDNLCDIPSMQELKDIVFSMSTDSAPGPNDMSGLFYRHWDIGLTGFMKERSITESITLAQEMIHNMNKQDHDSNMGMKLDMTKAYDRVSWTFLCDALKKFGFSDKWINMIWRVIANNWYSININGTRHGFFKSSRGLNQGDPISPSLFIICAEVLSSNLENLVLNNFVPFSYDPMGPIITHLSYADDTILFTSGILTLLV